MNEARNDGYACFVLGKRDDTLAIAYDSGKDVLTIQGVAYSGAMFRMLALEDVRAGDSISLREDGNGALTCVKVRRKEHE